MARLNPLQIHLLKTGVVPPEELDLHRCTGSTTRAALRLLAECMAYPGEARTPDLDHVRGPTSASKHHEAKEVVNRAAQIAEAAGLQFFEIRSMHGPSLVWVYSTPSKPTGYAPAPPKMPGPPAPRPVEQPKADPDLTTDWD